MSLNIKNLAFKGGGVLGIAYAGALKVLEDNGILQQVTRTAGTSAGAITAALVSLRYSAAEIYQIVNATDFQSFEDKWDPLRITTKYGLYEGNTFLAWMQKQVAGKGLPKDATFKNLQDAGCRELRVFATDLNTRGLKTFSYATTPNVIVAEAVRASMSIPLFFAAWKFPDNNPDGHIYVDGGTIYNYPIDAFDSGGAVNTETLGLHLDNLQEKPVEDDLTYDHIIKYVQNLFETLLAAQNIDFINNPTDIKRSVRIDNLGISPVNFKLTDDQKQKLYQSGIDYTQKYLEQQ